jgi:hypothetical protein
MQEAAPGTGVLLGDSPRNVVLVENCRDRVAAAIDDRVELVPERRVLTANSHRDVEHEGHERRIDLRRDRNDVERNVLPACEVAGYWAPYDCDIYFILRDRLDDSCSWIGLPVVAVNQVPPEIPDSPPVECVHRRCIRAVISNELHADSHACESRIVERAKVERPVTTRDERV